ncbi:MAG: hypothetical protein A3K09_05095 [Nitrospinae bacterium RIFCSPLOWO2_12_FULL_47_7]|nr:MAG: hypothetical protein A3K09_05095 [Nitrospinae bacterium RIFCSPLOWO2_12_FULL_47_7]
MDSKGLSIKHWIRERMLLLAIVIFAFGAVSYLSATKIFPHGSIWLDPVKEFSLLISMIGVVSLGYELFLRELTFNEYKTALQEIVNPDAVRLGIIGFYKDRSELGHTYTFNKLFQKARREIFIGGTSLLSISTASRELLKDRVLSGINIKLLVMDPNSKVVELITKQGRGKSTFVNEIKTSLLLLQKLQEDIEHETNIPNKGKFLIHTYDTIPSHSFISLDPNEPGGMIIADVGPYLGRSTPRPSMVVINKKDGLYEYWQEMNDTMWEESKFQAPDMVKLFDTQSKTIVFGSGSDTEFYDQQTEVWRNASICQTARNWKSIKGSQWVWIKNSPTLEEAKTGSHNKFRFRFDLPSQSKKIFVRADLFIRCDAICRIAINNIKLDQEYGGANYPDPFIIDISKHLNWGANDIGFDLISFAKPQATSPEDNRTGLVYRLDLEYRE